MARKFFVGGNWKCNGTTEEVKKIATALNEGKVPSQDVVDVPICYKEKIIIIIEASLGLCLENCGAPEFIDIIKSAEVKKDA
ncbi:hypothetical protein SAY87_023115 [Trapa incisa]|uniref:Triosephosphate isomerase n=1 Tax=Trapa incisa TaxID=236973 RepID=A0AAN7K574_9MYRT|nr:hypothetical protein SAY87_023115 [Trapa incisa]